MYVEEMWSGQKREVDGEECSMRQVGDERSAEEDDEDVEERGGQEEGEDQGEEGGLEMVS